MSLADLSIKRPIFISCLVILMLVVGLVSFRSLPVDLFPDVTFPVVTVTVPYPGAGPSEIETLISKPVEEELSTIAGLKRLTSQSIEGVSQVIAEFDLDVNIQYAEQQVRDKVSAARARLPLDVEEPVIQRIDPAALPILTLALQADLSESQLYDIADQVVKPRIEQVRDVGLVEIVGGRKREIQVALDRAKLARREVSVQDVARSIAASGENIPGGKVSTEGRETVFRSLGEFTSPRAIGSTLVSLYNNANPTRVSDLGVIRDTLEDETSRVFVNGRKSLFLNVYRQSNANTIAVADGARALAQRLSEELKRRPGHPQIQLVRDSSIFIRNNVTDVQETILIGIILTVLVVYFFLANGRSTIITGLALPNSLIGAFVLMAIAGFSVNVVTLLALSLAVGLLIDDAIVVRENIFRHIELGEDHVEAAKHGTKEVQLAVIATTLVVISVFGPVAFMPGIVGQFLKQFGLTVCFAMAISLFDALTIAPMLSAYFAGGGHLGLDERGSGSLWERTMGRVLRAFDRFQKGLEQRYERLIRITLRWPKSVLFASLVVFVLTSMSLSRVPKVFIPSEDSGEFSVELDLPPGASLDAMNQVASEADRIIRAHKEVAVSALTVGGRNGEANEASFYVGLVPSDQRSVTTTEFRGQLREQLKKMAQGDPRVVEYDPTGSGQNQPIMVNLIGNNQTELEAYSGQLMAFMKKDARLTDVDTSYRPGKPEIQIRPNPARAELLGVNSRTLGEEIRAQVEGLTPAKFRENGQEYDVRVRLLPQQRNLSENFNRILVPNVNGRLIRLTDVANPVRSVGPAAINRQDRGRYIQVSASLAPGASLADVLTDIQKTLKERIQLPPDVRYAFIGDAESFQEMQQSMLMAVILGVVFIYLVLASLYESFITPLTIMLALPLALCGAFLALYLTGESLSLFAILGIVMLLGVASKNSILLVDYTNHLMREGLNRHDALVRAGSVRLRPILMTSMALIAGTLPVAIGLNEASRQRTSMGVAIIGGLITSTILSLVVVPAAFLYIDRFKVWVNHVFARVFIRRGKRSPVQSGSQAGSVEVRSEMR